MNPRVKGQARVRALRHLDDPQNRRRPPVRLRRQRNRKLKRGLGFVSLVVILGFMSWWVISEAPALIERSPLGTKHTPPQGAVARTGKVLETELVQTLTPTQTLALIRQTQPNYRGTPGGIQEQTFRYAIEDARGNSLPVYARVYLPTEDAAGPMPIIAFAPGTTGIDDQCAASLEKPAQRNWANYASHMAAYAAQGYAIVITDYEGMRDPSRMHHYMVGDLEGRAVLDSVHALKNLTLTQERVDTSQVYLAGYSQGGHAALWADRLAQQYAPGLSIRGVIGFGPVTDVRQTLTDVVNGANILWFGPYVLYSYSHWYAQAYPLSQILASPYNTNLATDIAAHCIDTNIGHWGNKDIRRVYTPDFIAAMKTGSLASVSASLDQRLVENNATSYVSTTPKLINQGRLDNVILPAQSEAARQALCRTGHSVTYKLYPQATHYTTMVQSFQDTLAWIKILRSSEAVPQNCT